MTCALSQHRASPFAMINMSYTSLDGNRDNLERNDLIVEYFFAGYTYNEMIIILYCNHAITISLRQLHRVLRFLGLRRHTSLRNMRAAEQAIRHELQGSGSSLGYRAMTRRLQSTHGIAVSRRFVSAVQRALDPEGVQNRQRRDFSRRTYISNGPNYLIHIDGYDKLKRYGFPIHGAICGYSRRILWLKVANSNNNPQVVATFFLEYLAEIKAVPRCIRMDGGTENILVEDIQKAFRWEHTDDMAAEYSVIKGSLHSNQRIERWWLSNRQGGCQYWIDLFKDLESSGLLSTSNDIQIECMRFCFMDLLQNDLDRVRMEWNQHSIRRNRLSESPSGKPDLMYYLPNLYGTIDYKVQVSQEDLDQVIASYRYTMTMGCSEEAANMFGAIMRRRQLIAPNTVDGSLELFGTLISED